MITLRSCDVIVLRGYALPPRIGGRRHYDLSAVRSRNLCQEFCVKPGESRRRNGALGGDSQNGGPEPATIQQTQTKAPTRDGAIPRSHYNGLRI